MRNSKEQLSREMVARAKEEVKQREKAIMQRLMAEERQLFLEEHPEDRGNGFYERTLLTSSGIIEDLRVPRTRSGEFYPAILPGKRRASVDLGDLVLLMFQCGISTRKIQQVLEGVYGAFYSHASIARLTQVAEEEIEAWRMRPLKRAYFSVIIDAVFLSLKRGSYKKEPVYIALGTDHEGEREILGFWVLGSEGESAQAWRGDPGGTEGKGGGTGRDRGLRRSSRDRGGHLLRISRSRSPAVHHPCHAQLPEKGAKKGLGGGIPGPKSHLPGFQHKGGRGGLPGLPGGVEEALS